MGEEKSRDYLQVTIIYSRSNIPVWNNVKNIMSTMPKIEYFNKININVYHNICNTDSPLLAVGTLLNIG